MAGGWSLFQDEIRSRLDSLAASGCADPFFRGHADESWKLLPSLSRQLGNPRWTANKEARLFYTFHDLGAHLLPTGVSDWAVLFQMQHFGLPTRLLDWTTNFARALYFALKGDSPSPTIWILDPYTLNDKVGIGRSMGDLHRAYKTNYADFLKRESKPAGAMACIGDYTVTRIRHQAGTFTAHGDLETPLDEFAPDCVSKHVLPPDARQDAFEFLQLAGINEFHIFPDLEGLARHICEVELSLRP